MNDIKLAYDHKAYDHEKIFPNARMQSLPNDKRRVSPISQLFNWHEKVMFSTAYIFLNGQGQHWVKSSQISQDLM